MDAPMIGSPASSDTVPLTEFCAKADAQKKMDKTAVSSHFRDFFTFIMIKSNFRLINRLIVIAILFISVQM
jgi:hypothetical protein